MTHISQLTEDTFAHSACYFFVVKVTGNLKFDGQSPQFTWRLEIGLILPQQNFPEAFVLEDMALACPLLPRSLYTSRFQYILC